MTFGSNGVEIGQIRSKEGVNRIGRRRAMGRPKSKPRLNDQLRLIINQAVEEHKHALAKDLIDILHRQQDADAAEHLAEKREGQ